MVRITFLQNVTHHPLIMADKHAFCLPVSPTTDPTPKVLHEAGGLFSSEIAGFTEHAAERLWGLADVLSRDNTPDVRDYVREQVTVLLHTPLFKHVLTEYKPYLALVQRVTVDSTALTEAEKDLLRVLPALQTHVPSNVVKPAPCVSVEVYVGPLGGPPATECVHNWMAASAQTMAALHMLATTALGAYSGVAAEGNRRGRGVRRGRGARRGRGGRGGRGGGGTASAA